MCCSTGGFSFACKPRKSIAETSPDAEARHSGRDILRPPNRRGFNSLYNPSFPRGSYNKAKAYRMTDAQRATQPCSAFMRAIRKLSPSGISVFRTQ